MTKMSDRLKPIQVSPENVLVILLSRSTLCLSIAAKWHQVINNIVINVCVYFTCIFDLLCCYAGAELVSEFAVSKSMHKRLPVRVLGMRCHFLRELTATTSVK